MQTQKVILNDSFESIEIKTNEIIGGLTDDLIISYIKESFSIFKELKERYGENSKEFNHAKKEYIDLLKEINENKNYIQKNTGNGLVRIYSEFSDIEKLKNPNWIDTRINKGLDKLDESTNKTIEGKRKGKKFEISVTNFEKDLGDLNINKINSVALASYIQYLAKDLQLKDLEIAERLLYVLGKGDIEIGAKKLKELQKIWGGKKYSASENILRKKGLGYIVDGVINVGFREILESNFKLSETLINNFTNTESLDKFKQGLNEKVTREKYLEEAGKQDIVETETPSLELLSYGLGVEIKAKKEVILNNLSVKYKLSKEKSDEIYSKLENTNSAIQMVKILKPVIKVGSIKELIGLVLGIKEIEIQKEKVDIEIAKRDAGKNIEKLKKIEEKQNKIEKQEFEIKKSKIIEKHLDEKSIEIISKGENEEEILKELRIQNKELDQELTKLEKEQNNVEFKGNNSKNLDLKNTILNKNSSGELVSIDYQEDGKLTKIKIDELSLEEKGFTKTKEGLEKLIFFKKTLEDLNLGSLWSYRESIFRVLEKKFVGFFNERDNYLDKNEVRIFLIGILTSIGKGTKEGFLNKTLNQIIIFINTTNYKHKGTYIAGNSIKGMYVLENEFYKKFIKGQGQDGNDMLNWQKFDKALS
nr:hypothetical protein [Candidatus Gracilibacteria bacterium]